MNRPTVQGITAIEFDHFSLSYCGVKGARLQALRDLSLTIPCGEIITVVGPSGCGKTTFLRAVAGLLTPEHDRVVCDGSVRVYGLSPSEAKRQRMFAFAFQNPALLPWRNVRQNVSLPLEIVQRKGSRDARLADEMLAMVGLSDFDKAMPSELSGGMQQRANLARALVQEPRVLLMDEPFGSLDEVTRERLNFELLRIHQLRKPTILFVTHSLSEAVLLADRVVVLSRRPATIHTLIPVSFQQGRTESTLLSKEYIDLVRRLREIVMRGDTP